MNKSKLTSCIRRITTLLFTMIIAFNPHSVMASEESKALYPAAPGTYRHWLGGTTETAKIGKVDETGCNTSWLFDDNIYVTSTYNPTNRQSFALDIHSSLPQPIEVGDVITKIEIYPCAGIHSSSPQTFPSELRVFYIWKSDLFDYFPTMQFSGTYIVNSKVSTNLPVAVFSGLSNTVHTGSKLEIGVENLAGLTKLSAIRAVVYWTNN